MMLRSTLPTLLTCALISVLAGCQTTYIQRSEEVPSELEPAEVGAAITAAEDALLTDQPQLALDWMRVASELDGLPSAQRARVQQLLEIAANRWLGELSDKDTPPELLAEILDLDLPRQLAVTGALRGAALLVERGDYHEAFEVIDRIDRRYPTHHLRPEAGRLLVEAGLALSELDSSWWNSNRDHAFQALEYSSINYPLTPRGDLVLRRLAEMYEEDNLWYLAIARHEELAANFPESSLVPYSLARIPHLLLASIESPEYDRNAVLDARNGLQKWLSDYEGHEVAEQVRFDLAEARLRLAVSDLGIADFHVTVGNDYGARLHAMRALAEATSARDEDRARQAQAILDGLPPAPEAP
jgi:outer membrane protein assembly factor BamD (BamD/ComL family)